MEMGGQKAELLGPATWGQLQTQQDEMSLCISGRKKVTNLLPSKEKKEYCLALLKPNQRENNKTQPMKSHSIPVSSNEFCL